MNQKTPMILPLAMILCFMVGCEDQATIAELHAFRAQVEIEEQNKALVRRYLEGVDSYKIEIFDEVFSSDARIYFPGSFEPLSVDQVKQLADGFYNAFEVFAHNIRDLIADDDKVLARTRNSVTHTGEFVGISPTGKVIQFGELQLFRIDEGKIAELWIQEDFLRMYQQLGMELKPKEDEK